MRIQPGYSKDTVRIPQGYSRGTVRVQQGTAVVQWGIVGTSRGTVVIRDLAYFEDRSLVLHILFSLRVSVCGKVAKLVRYHRILSRLLRTYYLQATIQDQIQSQVIQCEHLSFWFQIGRGCRQGDPLSPYIFIICAKCLSTKLQKNKNIKGIKIELKEFKTSQFADDTTVILDGSDDSLNHTLEELEKILKNIRAEDKFR